MALGASIWLEPFTLVLLPSLLLLGDRRSPAKLAIAIGLALLPLTLHVLLMFGTHPGAAPTGEVLSRVLGSGRGWVGLPGHASNVGTDYALASASHLKFLANAGFVLAGASFMLAGASFMLAGASFILGPAFALRGRGAGQGGPPLDRQPLIFLATATAGLLAASFATRPIWGPWDWELFATTGLALALLAGTALSRLAPDVRQHLAVAAAGLQLCFVGFPLVVIGFGVPVDAGPFSAKRADVDSIVLGPAPSRGIAPWL
jgi:hypothetical protein